MSILPPKAIPKTTIKHLHGQNLSDDYAWLRADNWREVMANPAALAGEIRAYLEAENNYTEQILVPTQALQKQLVGEIRGRIVEDDASVPQPDGDWLYYARYRHGGQHPIFCRKSQQDHEHAAEQVLLDGDALAKEYEYFSLGGVAHSPDHTKLIYAFDRHASEQYEITVKDIATGEQLQPPLTQTTGQAVWAADNKSLFFTTLDEDHRPCRVWRIALGQPQSAAQLVYEEVDAGFFVSVSTTLSQRFIVISTHDHQTSEVWVLPADRPHGEFQLIEPRQVGCEYSLEDSGEDWTILTNADGAKDFKLMQASYARPQKAHWQTLLGHRPGQLILDVLEFADYRVRVERQDALAHAYVTDKKSQHTHEINFDLPVYALGVQSGLEFATQTLRFVLSSPKTPDETWDYDMASGKRVLRKRQQIPSGFDPDCYQVERIYATADDGARIPVTLLYKKHTPIDGTAPCLLYGYGAYGMSEAADFSITHLSLVDRGFVYAIAHVRGGKECGFQWYEQGRRENKPNTFSDFIRVAEKLIEQGYSSTKKLACIGGSAGGMLIGAVVNKRPDLWAAAVANVPFVDVLNTMLDKTLPLTPPEWPEWGNPITDKKAFETIKSYCPYTNVCAQDYPAMLVLAGLCDPRVTYWEPAKWVAKLRAHKTDQQPLLLKTYMSAGHGGVSGRLAILDEIALIYAFLLKNLL